MTDGHWPSSPFFWPTKYKSILTIQYLAQSIKKRGKCDQDPRESIDPQIADRSWIRSCRCPVRIVNRSGSRLVSVATVGFAGLTGNSLHIWRSSCVFTGVRGIPFDFPGAGTGKDQFLSHWNDNQESINKTFHSLSSPPTHLVEWFSCKRDAPCSGSADLVGSPAAHNPHNSISAGTRTSVKD